MWIKVAVCFLETFYNPFTVNELLQSPIWRVLAKLCWFQRIGTIFTLYCDIVSVKIFIQGFLLELSSPMKICHCKVRVCALMRIVHHCATCSFMASVFESWFCSQRTWNEETRPADCEIGHLTCLTVDCCWPRILLFFFSTGIGPVGPDELDISGWFYKATGHRHVNSNVERCRQDAKISTRSMHSAAFLKERAFAHEVGVKTW